MREDRSLTFSGRPKPWRHAWGDTASEESAKCLRIHQESLEGGNWILPEEMPGGWQLNPTRGNALQTQYHLEPPEKGKVVIPYVSQVSKQIADFFRSRDVMTHICHYNMTRASLVRPSDQFSMEEQVCVVYSIKCADCPVSYIRETERPLVKRFKEHRRPGSPGSEHITKESHRFKVMDVAVKCHIKEDLFRGGVAEVICLATDCPYHWTGIEAGIPSLPSTASCCRHVTLVTSLITGSHVTKWGLSSLKKARRYYRSKAMHFRRLFAGVNVLINSIMKNISVVYFLKMYSIWGANISLIEVNDSCRKFLVKVLKISPKNAFASA